MPASWASANTASVRSSPSVRQPSQPSAAQRVDGSAARSCSRASATLPSTVKLSSLSTRTVAVFSSLLPIER
ncbi:hypothetical protein HNR02_006674 [Amycolatopsis endophytica]|uniref:Uncharacterized protein n=1 Tax=Amycolatopsis endophytica TaxID=860233 RepID=A0A853BDI1_9PSEU|nr:hypothetical protein [Amycolatopsis endophytica]NYI93299.1 hypothetical protein [Amycolatopsis endophytica]